MRMRSVFVGTSLVALVTLSCAPAAPAPTGGPSQETEPNLAQPQRELVAAVRGEPPSLAAKPMVGFSGSLDRPKNVFNATLDFLDDREIARAQLAEGLPQLNTETWRVFPDGRMETTYQLKPNLTWHDGTPFSAEDYVFGWRVYSNPELGQSITRPVVQMEEVVAPDPRTVVIRWRQPYPDAVALDREFQALPRHILEALLGDRDPVAFTSHPFWSLEYVGLGPYRLTNWEPGAFLQGVAFDNYVLGRPKIDRIKVVFTSDPQTALANVMAGEIHVVADPLLGMSEGLAIEQYWAQDQGGTVLYSPVAMRTGLFQMRPEYVEVPALLDARVRRAMRLGMDVPTAVEVLTGGKGMVTYTLTHPKVDYFPEIERAIQKYGYDPRRAQQIMEEAGFRKGPDGFFMGSDGQTVRSSLALSAGERQEAEAAVFVDSMRRTGFDMSMNVVPVQLIRDPRARAVLPGFQLRGGAGEFVRYTSEQIPRPENRWHGDNRGGWSNPEYDRLFNAYVSTLDRVERVRLMAQMERIANEDAAVIPVLLNVVAIPHVAAVQGPVARQTPLSGTTFTNVHLWEWRS